MCNKGIMVGKQHKHHPGVAGGRWKKRAPKTQKIFKPNLHSARILVGSNYKRMKLCTKCLRRAKEAMKKTQNPVVVEVIPLERTTISA
ncbi:MAG: L28 family ribosomal protein [Candidatus Levybacteria bacterium]|nr:L28 family ribosomal protein [Candidatus Levybacteria bacterium]